MGTSSMPPSMAIIDKAALVAIWSTFAFVHLYDTKGVSIGILVGQVVAAIVSTAVVAH